MATDLLTALQLAGPIPKADYSQVLAAWTPQTVAEGDLLLRTDDVCSNLYFIQSGVLRTFTHTPAGREVTHTFLREQQFCTILAGFDDQKPTPFSIQAACASQLLTISRARLDRLKEQLPYFSALITGLIQQTLREKIQVRQTYLGQDAATSYQLFLQRQPDVARRVPQHMIASYLGITPQSLSRLRKARV